MLLKELFPAVCLLDTMPKAVVANNFQMVGDSVVSALNFGRNLLDREINDLAQLLSML